MAFAGWCQRPIVILFLSLLLLPQPMPASAARDPANPQDFFGVVGRDPWYEYNTDPERHPLDVNRTFLEGMMADIAAMGAGWVRIEFHAEYDQPVGPGWIDLVKHDWYVQELAPRYGVKLLAVMGSGILADLDPTYRFRHINDPPAADGHNRYSRAFVHRVSEVIDRYGDRLGAIEILNEPNANQILHWETLGQEKAVNPAIYGRIAVDLYERIKPAHPSVQLVAGSLLHDHRSGQTDHLEWLRAVYESDAVRAYIERTGHAPWDGVSIHPYGLSPAETVTDLRRLRALQTAYGDTSGIWVTEIGYPATPAEWSVSGIMDPTPQELEQAEFLRQIYTLLRDETPFVERVFWFKYEDFGEGHDYANWGLVRLRDSAFRYGREATPWPRKPAYLVYQSLARPELLPTTPVPPPLDAGPDVRYFPETGHTVRGPFLRYWREHGGLARFGYPKTEVFFVAGRAVQYFERARFEYWPEFRGTPHEVQLGLLGWYVVQGRQFERQPPPSPGAPPDPNQLYFPETGQYLRGAFKRYWERHGGLAVFGYPISGELHEVNPEDGKTYTVQYFERARFEYHPEHAGTAHEVQLGLLGNQVLATMSWYR